MPNDQWKMLDVRPGWAGENRAQREKEYNQMYGEGNWRVRWRFDNRALDIKDALDLYELSYRFHFQTHRLVWNDLVKIASNIWVEDESDVESGNDYTIQKAKAMHYEDIAIRRILKDHGRNFKGDRLVRVRGDSSDLCGKMLSSMYVPFVCPSYIQEPHVRGWWQNNSVEDWWQSNKSLQVINQD